MNYESVSWTVKVTYSRSSTVAVPNEVANSCVYHDIDLLQDLNTKG